MEYNDEILGDLLDATDASIDTLPIRPEIDPSDPEQLLFSKAFDQVTGERLILAQLALDYQNGKLDDNQDNSKAKKELERINTRFPGIAVSDLVVEYKRHHLKAKRELKNCQIELLKDKLELADIADIEFIHTPSTDHILKQLEAAKSDNPDVYNRLTRLYSQRSAVTTLFRELPKSSSASDQCEIENVFDYWVTSNYVFQDDFGEDEHNYFLGHRRELESEYDFCILRPHSKVTIILDRNDLHQADSIIKCYEQVETKLGRDKSLRKPITVLLSPSQKFVGPMGVASGIGDHVLISNINGSLDTNTAFHEFAHAISGQAYGECASDEISEGLAVYIECDLSGNDLNDVVKHFPGKSEMQRLRKHGKTVGGSHTEMLDNAGLDGLSEADEYAYSYMIGAYRIKFIAEQFGWEKVIELYKYYCQRNIKTQNGLYLVRNHEVIQKNRALNRYLLTQIGIYDIEEFETDFDLYVKENTVGVDLFDKLKNVISKFI